MTARGPNGSSFITRASSGTSVTTGGLEEIAFVADPTSAGANCRASLECIGFEWCRIIRRSPNGFRRPII
jgi:hypothetical protein